MFLRRSASNQNVINVRVNEWEAMQQLINETLEVLSSIPQTKWHSQKLKLSKRHDNCHLGNINRVNRNLMKGTD